MDIELDSLDSISSKIKNMRRALGISQKRLAIMAGKSQSTVARIESDIESLNPSYQTIFEIIDSLNNANKANVRPGLLNKKASEIMHKRIVYAAPNDTIAKAIAIVRENDLTQLPILDRRKTVIGTIYQKDLLDVATKNPGAIGHMKVTDVLMPALPQVDKDTDLTKLKPVLENWNAVIVTEKNRAIGIITIYDILQLI
ncbi:MAG: CBS domain-containing protein [Candidatus Micrarchaeota archaeon]|nr:CBS domain-containing protein [Candidatus Micrarchaeota archaeon]